MTFETIFPHSVALHTAAEKYVKSQDAAGWQFVGATDAGNQSLFNPRSELDAHFGENNVQHFFWNGTVGLHLYFVRKSLQQASQVHRPTLQMNH